MVFIHNLFMIDKFGKSVGITLNFFFQIDLLFSGQNQKFEN